MVSGLCRALLRDPVEAEDAAQQVFLSAHRSLLNGAEPREPAAWLATIARNECWARISARMREPLPTESADEVSSTVDPVAEAIRRADLAALWRAIRALPQQQRDALLLREFGGLRYDELAAALAVSEPAVESLLFRARARLRAQLQSAYAALAPLARIVVGSGGPALAAKAIALGVGAAAVTGTAVVVEGSHHQRHTTAPPVRVHVVRALPVATPIAAAPAPVVVHRVAAVTTTAARAEPQSQERESAPSRDDSHDVAARSSDDGGRTTQATTRSHDGGTDSTSSDDGDRQPTTATTTTTDIVTLPTATLPEVSGDGGGSGNGGGSDGSDSSGD